MEDMPEVEEAMKDPDKNEEDDRGYHDDDQEEDRAMDDDMDEDDDKEKKFNPTRARVFVCAFYPSRRNQ